MPLDEKPNRGTSKAGADDATTALEELSLGSAADPQRKERAANSPEQVTNDHPAIEREVTNPNLHFGTRSGDRIEDEDSRAADGGEPFH